MWKIVVWEGKMNTLTALKKIGTDKEAIFVQVISECSYKKGALGTRLWAWESKCKPIWKTFIWEEWGKCLNRGCVAPGVSFIYQDQWRTCFPLFSYAGSPRPLLLCWRGPSYHHNRQSNLCHQCGAGFVGMGCGHFDWRSWKMLMRLGNMLYDWSSYRKTLHGQCMK